MIKFKIRETSNKKVKDKRLKEKGIVCKFKSKQELKNIIKILEIEIPKSKKNIICKLIEQKLIKYENKHVDGFKWFYFLNN